MKEVYFPSAQTLRGFREAQSVDTAARTYYYQVRSFEIVDPRNVNALRFHNKNELTLITCYPFSYIGPASKRFVVHAEPVVAPEKCSHS